MLLAMVACGNTPGVYINQTTAVATTQEQKASAKAVANFAKKEPPTNAASLGVQSAPQAGRRTLPIRNVEVFQFTAEIDDDHQGEETMYWALAGDIVYVWGEVAIVCVDEDGVETGESGGASFIYVADGEKYGWFTSTDACGYSTDFGCAGDDRGEVCGGCDFNETFVSCQAIATSET